jgi:hypothetical protein
MPSNLDENLHQLRPTTMKRILPALFAGLLAVSGLSSATAANLVTNGSFESGAFGIGSFSGWQTVLGDSSTFVDSSGQTGSHYGQASDGLWSAYFGSTASSGGSSISQNLSTQLGQSYLLSFDLANSNEGSAASNRLSVLIGSSNLFSLSDVPSQDYEHVQATFLASATSTPLQFSAYNDTGYLELDNVSVSAVPEIDASSCTGALAFLSAALFIIRGRRHRTA